MRFEDFSFHHGREIIEARPVIHGSILAAVVNFQESRPSQRRISIFLTDQLTKEFLREGWEKEVLVMKKQPREQRFDLVKERVAINIEFSRYDFLSRHYLRFLSAYNADKIDVGVLITHAESGLSRVKGKAVAPSMTRVKADLMWLRGIITVPIWVIGLK